MLFKQLQYFMSVAECRHFTKASERLFVSQSALSQQITKLENDLGITLINRDSHPIELTPAGRVFAKQASIILADLKTLEEQMEQWRDTDSSSLRIGIIAGLSNLPLTEILSDFNTHHRSVKLSLVNHLSKKLCYLLDEELLDVAIFAMPANIQSYDFDVIPLQKEPFFAIFPEKHPLAKNELFDIASAKNENFIFPSPENVSHDSILSNCKKHGFQPKIISYCNRPRHRINLVQAGFGISLISASGLMNHPTKEGIIVRPLTEPFHKTIVIARKKIRHAHGTVQAFWQYIETYAKKNRIS